MHLPDRVDLVILEFDTEDPQFVLIPSYLERFELMRYV